MLEFSETTSIAPKAISTSQEQVRRLASKERWQFQKEVKGSTENVVEARKESQASVLKDQEKYLRV